MHFGTNRIQLLLAKTAALLGVHIHLATRFKGVDEQGREYVAPPLSTDEGGEVGARGEARGTDAFDVIVDCGGKPTLRFQRKEVQCSRAIGIVCQFQRGKSEEEERLEVGRECERLL